MGIPTCVGCSEHSHELTRAIMNFYLTTRMIFACKEKMKVVAEKKKLEKSLTKQSRLVESASKKTSKKNQKNKVTKANDNAPVPEEDIDDPEAEF